MSEVCACNVRNRDALLESGCAHTTCAWSYRICMHPWNNDEMRTKEPPVGVATCLLAVCF